VVYNGTMSGLNDSLFVPWYMLQTSFAMTRTLDVEYFCGDTDLGKCFLNFWAHQELIPYLGVDVTHTFSGEPRYGDYGTWTHEVTKISSSNFRELLNLKQKKLKIYYL
jgi:hypothetical protein